MGAGSGFMKSRELGEMFLERGYNIPVKFIGVFSGKLEACAKAYRDLFRGNSSKWAIARICHAHTVNGKKLEKFELVGASLVYYSKGHTPFLSHNAWRRLIRKVYLAPCGGAPGQKIKK